MAAKWTEEEKDLMAKLWAEGKSQVEIGKLFGVSGSTIAGIMNRDRARFPPAASGNKFGPKQATKGRERGWKKRKAAEARELLGLPEGARVPKGTHAKLEERSNEALAAALTGTVVENPLVEIAKAFAAKRAAKPAKPKVELDPNEKKLTGQGMPLASGFRHSFVKTAAGNKRMFIYKGNEQMPLFTFNYIGGYWRGHGIAAKETAQIFRWVNVQHITRKEIA
ncbi:hypothetical protein EVB87_067 [Rhizobium phage RHph_N28_1]|nr:hypothetical protein EVB87_067 [Rhizobium phage RHph_N28_1]QIG74095.1 hypothetical protein EVC07_067 [Rhizobium phage RHph_N42]QIG74701.1 hypothetical protein EVC12_066 [Rhizobium phage RHph_I42]